MSWFRKKPLRIVVGIGVLASLSTACFKAQDKPEQNAPVAPPAAKSDSGKAEAAAATEQQELQRAIDQASNDRAALMRNLLEFLKKYPQTAQRPQIYRAIVESSLQLRNFSTATEYAERMVSLNPEDASTNLLAIQLLERYGDAAGWRRAVNYCGRVLEIVHRESTTQKSPRQSSEQFEKDRQHDVAAVLLVRGQLYQKLNESQNAQKDFESSYKMAPGAPAAEHLGELAEIRKDLAGAIREYGVAFALADSSPGRASRAELRKKLGNAWRLAHGSEDGLGDYLLSVYDETVAAITGPKPSRNTGRKEPSNFVLRKVADGSPFAMAGTKGKVVVLNFWTTWCGPCREWEPHFENVARHFAGQESDVVFFDVNCDEDETLVAPYLAEEKPKTSVLFADGLDRLLGVDSFPTTLVLDRPGKIAYRAEGVDTDRPEASLLEAIQRALRARDTPAAAVAE